MREERPMEKNPGNKILFFITDISMGFKHGGFFLVCSIRIRTLSHDKGPGEGAKWKTPVALKSI